MDVAADRSTTGSANGAPHGSPSAHRASVLVPYLIGMAALVATAIVLSLVMDGGWVWVLTLLGAAVIGVLLSAAAVPHLHAQ